MCFFYPTIIFIINSFPQIIMTGGLVALKITHIISWKVIMLAKFRFIIGRMKEEESLGEKIRIMTAEGGRFTLARTLYYSADIYFW